jgi:hypothetical protein
MISYPRQSPPSGIRAADIFLIILLLALSIFGFYRARATSRQGSIYRIELEGEVTYRLPLAADTLICLAGRTGPISIRVHGGKVRVLKTSCPLEICKRTGWIDKPGEAIICVPNRMVLTIEGGKQGAIDAVTE